MRPPTTTLAVAALLGAGLVATTAPGAHADGATLYAYAGGTASPAGCPADTAGIPSTECSLGAAIDQLSAGDTIYLATSGDDAAYVGTWEIPTEEATDSSPLTFAAAPGLASPPVLDGNHGQQDGCSTATCAASILDSFEANTIHITGVTFRDADGDGSSGAIESDGNLTITDSTFTDNVGGQGGAVSVYGSSLVITDSTFTGNSASFGGAVLDLGGTVSVSGSTFDANHADVAGGAAVTDSSTTVTGSTFTQNTSDGDGGAIRTGHRSAENDSSDPMTLTVRGSTFDRNHAGTSGGAIDAASAIGSLLTAVSESTFTGNTAVTRGGAIANGASDTFGDLLVLGSTLSADTVGQAASEIDSAGASSSTVVAGDLISGTCTSSGGTWVDDGYNAVTSAGCTRAAQRDVVSAAASHLQALATQPGAATATLLPLGDNPAVGRVPNGASAAHAPAALAALCPRTDQTGSSSAAGHACNAGSIDASVPLPPKPTLVLAGGHAVAAGSKHTFTGTTTPGAAVGLYAGSKRVASGKANAAGAFSIPATIKTTAAYTGLAGGQVSTPIKVTAVKLTLTVPGPRPIKAGNHKLTGHAPAGKKVTLLVDGQGLDTTTAKSNNTWTLVEDLEGTATLQILSDGVRSVATRVTAQPHAGTGDPGSHHAAHLSDPAGDVAFTEDFRGGGTGTAPRITGIDILAATARINERNLRLTTIYRGDVPHSGPGGSNGVSLFWNVLADGHRFTVSTTYPDRAAVFTGTSTQEITCPAEQLVVKGRTAVFVIPRACLGSPSKVTGSSHVIWLRDATHRSLTDDTSPLPLSRL